MALKPNRKVSVRGSLQELRTIIEELKKTQAFELSSFKKGKVEDMEASAVEGHATLMARVSAVLDFARSVTTDKSLRAVYGRRENLSMEELQALASRRDEVIALVERLEKLSTRSHEIKATTKKNTETMRELRPFINLDAPFSELVDTKSSFVMMGVIPTLQLEKFTEDFDLENFVINQFPTDSDAVGIVIIGHKDDTPVIDAIHNYGFTRYSFNFERTAAGQIEFLTGQNAELVKEMEKLQVDATLTVEEIVLLKSFHDYLDNEIDTERILAGTIKTKDYYVLNGWVLDGEKKKVQAIILAINPKTKIKWGRTVELDKPPVQIQNNRVVAPYQAVTSMFGAPGKHDIDPNPFVAIFYFFFFGMMIGDIGYGLVMIVATTLFLTLKKPGGGARQLILVILMGGISAVLWGVIMNGFFGFQIMSDTIVDPIGEPMQLLVLAMALGVVHLLFGIVLNFYNLMRLGRTMDAICDAGTRIVFFIGAIMLAGGMFLGGDDGIPALQTAGMIVTITGVAAVALTAGRKRKGLGKVVGGFGGIYGFVNYVSDILSYARLFGLALVGAVIAFVANTMGGMFMPEAITGFGDAIGAVIGVVVAVAFHAFNMGLAILSAYIHNARLQFIEFFSKFYVGDGTLFTPMGGTLRYTAIRSNLDQVAVA
ncbi:MAG: hypothetical protein FWE38_02770 [Firmicutes bacterium]|nr:hypothetical protein [Bacillota bacterium]